MDNLIQVCFLLRSTLPLAVEFRYAAMGKESFHLQRCTNNKLERWKQARIRMGIEGLHVLHLMEDSS